MTFMRLADTKNDVTIYICYQHIGAYELDSHQVVTVYLLGGQTLRLSKEASREFVEHIKSHAKSNSG
jgi:hypothetical protein